VFEVLQSVEDGYFVGIVDSSATTVTDNSAFIYLEGDGAGTTYLGLEVRINGHFYGRSLATVRSDGLEYLAIERGANGQVTFYVNEVVRTHANWVLPMDVPFYPAIYADTNNDHFVFSVDESEGLDFSCVDSSGLELPPILQSDLLPFLVYPNPVTSHLRLTLPVSSFGESGNLIIVNGVGERVGEQRMEGGSKELVVDVSGYEPGIYFVWGVFGKKIYRSRFVRND